MIEFVSPIFKSRSALELRASVSSESHPIKRLPNLDHEVFLSRLFSDNFMFSMVFFSILSTDNSR